MFSDNFSSNHLILLWLCAMSGVIWVRFGCGLRALEDGIFSTAQGDAGISAVVSMRVRGGIAGNEEK